jgi:hypothetical protein
MVSWALLMDLSHPLVDPLHKSPVPTCRSCSQEQSQGIMDLEITSHVASVNCAITVQPREAFVPIPKEWMTRRDFV